MKFATPLLSASGARGELGFVVTARSRASCRGSKGRVSGALAELVFDSTHGAGVLSEFVLEIVACLVDLLQAALKMGAFLMDALLVSN